MTKKDNLLPILAVALLGAGAYYYFKTREEPPINGNGEEPPLPPPNGEEPGEPGEWYPVSFVVPIQPGLTWTRLFPNFVTAKVENPYGIRKNVYVGMSMMEDVSGDWIDFKLKNIDIGAWGSKDISWTIWPYQTKPGLYWIIVAVWYRSPEYGDERIGEAETNVKFSTI